MRQPLLGYRLRTRAGFLLLALLLFRAYVPAGFMPAAGVPFALELCPAGLSAMPAAPYHHHAGTHGGTHADFATCPFGSALGAGPLSHHVGFESPEPARSAPIAAVLPPCLTRRPQPSYLPRGPPSLA